MVDSSLPRGWFKPSCEGESLVMRGLKKPKPTGLKNEEGGVFVPIVVCVGFSLGEVSGAYGAMGRAGGLMRVCQQSLKAGLKTLTVFFGHFMAR